jgi:hypothetical protein
MGLFDSDQLALSSDNEVPFGFILILMSSIKLS